MSYQVLARKWRPASFEQVVGQSHVLHALTNALSQQRLHHAYLFTGTRGVGKTSLARLFAKGLNCETGITATPCGKCASCQEIAQGRFVDLIEVDAASRTKVDDTRELLDNVQYRPTRGRFKVYLIDEVHMLSRSSFNALLKTLEEPPEHVKFLLATTDPQKLPVTVLSRCLQFNLKSLSQQEISQQLGHILTQEQIPTENAALDLLAKAANGSMRDALSLTDQAIAFGAGNVKLTQVQTMLGSVDERQVISLLQALVNADIEAVLKQADQVLTFGADANEVLRSLLELLHQITLAQFAPAAAQLSMYAEQIKAFAAALAPEQVQLYYQLLLHGRKDLPFAPDPKSGLEMALLRAVAFEPKAAPKRWLNQDESSAAKLTLPPATETIAKPTPSSPVVAAPTESSVAEVKRSASDPAEPITATSQNAITPPVIEDHDVQTDEPSDESLAAEQALIMSQADSMGYQGYADEVEQQAADNNYAQQFSSESYEQVNTVQKHYVTDDDEADAVPFHDELTGDMFGAGASDDVSNTSQSEPSQPIATEDENIHATNNSVDNVDGLFGDDVLDQVLASRDSLLKDIEALSADDESVVSSPGLGPKKVTQEPRGALPESVVTQSPPEERNEPQLANDAAVENDTQLTPSGVNVTDLALAETEEPVAHAVNVSSIVDEPTASVTSPTTHVEANNSNISLGAHDNEQHQPATASAPVLAPTGHTDDLSWYKLVASANIGGRVRQLAANSICYALGAELKLLLKPDQKHLAAKSAVAQMESAMSEALGESCQAIIEVGIDEQRETPLEIRHRFNRELLAQAKDSLIQDENVQWLMSEMGAQIDEDSLSYPGEMLTEKTALIVG